jgi:hypothetical protein
MYGIDKNVASCLPILLSSQKLQYIKIFLIPNVFFTIRYWVLSFYRFVRIWTLIR